MTIEHASRKQQGPASDASRSKQEVQQCALSAVASARKALPLRDANARVLPAREHGASDAMIDQSRQFVTARECHRVYKKRGDVFVDHVEKHGGKWDIINLTDTSGARTIAAGVKAVRDYHDKGGKSYYRKAK